MQFTLAGGQPQKRWFLGYWQGCNRVLVNRYVGTSKKPVPTNQLTIHRAKDHPRLSAMNSRMSRSRTPLHRQAMSHRTGTAQTPNSVRRHLARTLVLIWIGAGILCTSGRSGRLVARDN